MPNLQRNGFSAKALKCNHVFFVKLKNLNKKHMDAAALPSQMNAEFISAVTGGRSELVKILLADPRVNPGVGDNWGIRRAACGSMCVR